MIASTASRNTAVKLDPSAPTACHCESARAERAARQAWPDLRQQGGVLTSRPLGHGRRDMGGKRIVDIGLGCDDTGRGSRRNWRDVGRIRSLQNRRLFLLVELLKCVEQLENLRKLGIWRTAHSGGAAAMLRRI